jgi:Zn-dependent membrane protease YugP
MMMPYFDKYYLMLVLPAFVLSLIAQAMIKMTFSKFSKIRNTGGYTGADAASAVLRKNGINDVRIEKTPGRLTDHYDPRKKVLRLSGDVYGSSSVAAVGVAAHEAGHAMQHARKYGPLMLRSTLVPAANIGSNIGPYIAIAGLMFSMDILINVGILLFTVGVLFYVITLPVEFNASSRALAELESGHILNQKELAGARNVLRAAAMTYLASAAVAFANLLRLVLLARNRDRD